VEFCINNFNFLLQYLTEEAKTQRPSDKIGADFKIELIESPQRQTHEDHVESIADHQSSAEQPEAFQQSARLKRTRPAPGPSKRTGGD
jgi:hypothetical protein